MTPIDLNWIFIILSTFQPMLQQRVLAARRTSTLRALERRRGSRAITLIPRRENFAFLGIPFGGYIDIDDSEAVIRAIEMTGKEVPVDLVLHTPGGLLLAAEQIAAALADHPAPVTVHVPHYAMSGGTLIALTADQIVMSPSAVLGPVDPQIGEYPAASICAAFERKDPNETDDKTLILGDISRKAQRQVRDFVKELLCRQFSDERAAQLATALREGRWTHDFPHRCEALPRARAQGVDRASRRGPQRAHATLSAARARRPSVEYIPLPYDTPQAPRHPQGGPRSTRP